MQTHVSLDLLPAGSEEREVLGVGSIRDFPYHATFREKGTKLACADKLSGFLSLTLCNKANYDPRQHMRPGKKK